MGEFDSAGTHRLCTWDVNSPSKQCAEQEAATERCGSKGMYLHRHCQSEMNVDKSQRADVALESTSQKTHIKLEGVIASDDAR